MKKLVTQIKRMWNVKAKVIPVITGATGTIGKYIQIIPEQHNGKA